jgi:drug/metabolite transporter (DMT)-like permease
MARKLIATLLITAGIIWCVMFPKKATLDPDMIASVCLGVGLIASGALVWWLPRLRPLVGTLAFVLLWSLLGNALLWSMSDQYSNALQRSSVASSAELGPEPLLAPPSK